MSAKCYCGNCGWKGTEKGLASSLFEIDSLSERITPGDEVPVGECPKCGALAYISKASGLPEPTRVNTIALTDMQLGGFFSAREYDLICTCNDWSFGDNDKTLICLARIVEMLEAAGVKYAKIHPAVKKAAKLDCGSEIYIDIEA